MSLARRKKKIDKATQFPEIDSGLLELERQLHLVNSFVSNLQDSTKKYLQPNPNARAKIFLLYSYQKMKGRTNSVKYPQAESTLAEAFSQFGGRLGDRSPYALALVELGSSFQNLSQAKDKMDIQVEKDFLRPLYEMQHKELKQIIYLLKKCNGCQRDFDIDNNKGDKVDPEDLQTAQVKLGNAKEILFAAMTKCMEKEAERTAQLYEFAKIIRQYHQECFRTMDAVTASLAAKLIVSDKKPARDSLKVSSSSSVTEPTDSFK